MKFRSMRVDTPRDMPTHLLSDPQRWITKIGGFLRKTSLDELPQILQILSGKMSIVGPRPALGTSTTLLPSAISTARTTSPPASPAGRRSWDAMSSK